MADHPSIDTLSGYVRDALSPFESVAVERHVTGCGRCARALSAEARVEVLLEQAATWPRDRRSTRLSSLFAAAAAAVFALGAATLSRHEIPNALGVEVGDGSAGDDSAGDDSAGLEQLCSVEDSRLDVSCEAPPSKMLASFGDEVSFTPLRVSCEQERTFTPLEPL